MQALGTEPDVGASTGQHGGQRKEPAGHGIQ